jgi:pyroglutamyl-peptidase
VSRTLVTGFGPFQGVEVNPSETLAKASGVPHVILDVTYAAAEGFVQTLDSLSYDNLLMLGVASNRSQMSVELEAKNLRSGADVAGVSADGVIDLHGPQALKSTMWTHELVELLKLEFPHEVSLSFDAGTYLCNYLYYKALQILTIPRVGFLHLVMPDQLSLATQENIVLEVLSEFIG